MGKGGGGVGLHTRDEVGGEGGVGVKKERDTDSTMDDSMT